MQTERKDTFKTFLITPERSRMVGRNTEILKIDTVGVITK